jgi:hypothetical protein
VLVGVVETVGKNVTRLSLVRAAHDQGRSDRR